MNPPPPTFEQRVGYVFDLQAAELEYYSSDALPLDERKNFQLFAIGYKYMQNNVFGPPMEPENWTTVPPQEVIDNWNGADLDELNRLIRLGHDTPNPRLDPRNFDHSGGALLAFARQQPNDASRAAFLHYAYGSRICYPQHRDMNPKNEEQIIAGFRPEMTADNSYTIQVGRRHFFRYLQIPGVAQRWKEMAVREKMTRGIPDLPAPPAPAQPARPSDYIQPRANFPGTRKGSDENAHIYDRGRNPSATDADVAWVNAWDLEQRPKGSRWVFECTIYQNSNYPVASGKEGQRVVHLFALIDPNNTIILRMVVKIVGHKTVAEVKRDINTEFYLQDVLSRRGNPNILKAYRSSVRDRPYVPKLGYIYMEYAAYGSLADLLQRFKTIPNQPQIPEPFLWLIFYDMASALYTCQAGYANLGFIPPHMANFLNELLNRAPHWRPIVNPDTKPANVVLGEASTLYPSYKVAKLIDWGLAFTDQRYNTAAQKNARGWFGTRGYCPPEQYFPADWEFADVPVDMKSCTFNIGLIMLYLMEGTDRIMTYPTDELRHLNGYAHTYSVTLENLMRRYLAMDSRNRPGSMEILSTTTLGLERWEKAYVDVKGKGLPAFASIQFDGEEFALGAQWPGRKGKQRVPKKKETKRKRDEDENDNRNLYEQDIILPKKKAKKPSPKHKGKKTQAPVPQATPFAPRYPIQPTPSAQRRLNQRGNTSVPKPKFNWQPTPGRPGLQAMLDEEERVRQAQRAWVEREAARLVREARELRRSIPQVSPKTVGEGGPVKMVGKSGGTGGKDDPVSLERKGSWGSGDRMGWLEEW